MSWSDPLLNLVVKGLGGVPNLMLPSDWKRQARERLNDFNPFRVIADNSDLLRAARLAWVEAARDVLNVAKSSVQSGGPAFDRQAEIVNFIVLAEKIMREIRQAALDRRTHPGINPIDRHLQIIIQGTSEFISPGDNTTHSQTLTQDFAQTLAAVCGRSARELPPMFTQIARNGIPMLNGGPNRSFGELVFAAFAEILKNPDRYPEASEAFIFDMQVATRKLTEELLIYTRDIVEGQARAEGQLKDVKVQLSDIEGILRQMAQTAETSPDASDEALLAEYRQLLDRLDQREFKQVLNTVPGSLAIYRAQCIARWAQPRYAVDKRFTPLTLLLDQGEEATGERYQKQQTDFDDLRNVLAAVKEEDFPVLVVTGAPGSGKSTLLRRLELDIANQALREIDAVTKTAPLTLFLPMNAYGQKGEGIPKPLDWIAQQWNRQMSSVLKFDDALRQPLLLLLDGLNEMPHADRNDYAARLAAWKRFLEDVALHHPSVRVIFSCRTIDYGNQLTTNDLSRIPLVEITPLSELKIEQFLSLYSPDHGAQLFAQIKQTQQLELYCSPYYLKLLIEQAWDGRIPQGRAALFTGFVRGMLKREIRKDNPRVTGYDWLLSARERQHILNGDRRNDYDLPKRGKLFNVLAAFAFQLQTQRQDGDSGNKVQVRIDEDAALDMLAAHIDNKEQQQHLLDTAVDLQLLDRLGFDVLFVHQLMQEYFAARYLAERFDTADSEAARNELVGLAATAWRTADFSPKVAEILSTLPRSGTLPDLPTTGWEETFTLAAAMVMDRDAFVRALAQVNLSLAGRCAAQPDAGVSDPLRRDLQQLLVARSRDRDADLRARIHAGDALGRLGDPRFEERQGLLGRRYLAPPMIAIDGGAYTIGSDEGLVEGEAPRHAVQLAPFSLGQFAVTNAEFQCFIDAGGYDDLRWWDTPQAQRWQRGEGTGEIDQGNLRYLRGSFKSDVPFFTRTIEELALTETQIQQWQSYLAMTDDAFEALLKVYCPDQRFDLPEFWSDAKYNAPNQPVVGVCWFEARAYCAWLSAQTGQHYRLPTEAEWEAAAGGKAGRRYPWGEAFDATGCNSIEVRLRRVTPVGVFPEADTPPSSASAQGCADLAGNVWEWCSSQYQPYPYRVEDGREAPEEGVDRVLRGGSWFNDGRDCRSAYRGHNDPSNRSDLIGFRLARGH
jgi:formylglycine-generating enzyme required for sulfatase activity